MKAGIKRVLVAGYCNGIVPAAVVRFAFRVLKLKNK